MSFPVIDRDTLTRALGKMNRLGGEQTPHLEDEEIIALHAFVEGRLGADIPSEKSRDFLERIQKVLARFPKPPLPDIPVERRRNDLLRNAIGRFRRGAAITESERSLIMGTLQYLQGQDHLVEAQVRLRDLLESIMGIPREDDMSDMDEASEVNEAAIIEENALSALRRLDPSECMHDRDRETVTEMGGVPINKALRVFSTQDSLEWTGAVEENDLLEVLEGDVHIRGDVSGVVVAKGDIIVHGGIMDGMVITSHGMITAGRVAAGAQLIAQRGAIDIEEAENHDLIFASGDCRIGGNLTGGAVYGASLSIAGTVRDAQCHMLSGFDAHTVAESANGRMRIHFRQILLPEDYGAEVDDDAIGLVRTTLRARYKLIVSEAWQQAYMRDKRHAQLTALYTLKVGTKNSPTPQELRNAQILRNYFEVLIEIARRGLSLLLRAADGPQAGMELIFSSAADDVSSAAKVFEKDIELIPEELARQAKPTLLTATRHLVNAMKKARDASAQRKPSADPLGNLNHRIEEWQQELEEAIEKLEAILSGMAPALGPALKADHDQLDRLLNSALAESGPKATGGLLRMMRSGLERIGPGIERWEGNAAAARIEYLGAKERLLEEKAIRFTTSTTNTAARATKWGRGVELWTTRPRDGALYQADKLALEEDYPAGTAFVLHGLSIKIGPVETSEAPPTSTA